MTEKERMLSGKLYKMQGEELRSDRAKARRILKQINRAPDLDGAAMRRLFCELFGSVGSHFLIEPPFSIDYGCNTYIGERFFANYDCIIIDVARVEIGDDVLFGPRVGLYTAGHPLDAQVRKEGLEYGRPIRIEDDVWIGGGVTVTGGVTIGAQSVIGAGSVVTRDIPAGVLAAGVPCRVIRPIDENDRVYWEAERARYYESMQ